MEEKVNAIFDDSINSQQVYKDLIFTLASNQHKEDLVRLMSIRNPQIPISFLNEKIDREIQTFSDGKEYGLFIASKGPHVIGFCRYYFSRSVPKEKIKFDHPDGCYCMGMMVDPKYRRHNVAKFLWDNRMKWIQGLGVKQVYSIVACDNSASLRMHQKFGFDEVSRAAGYMNVSFDCGEGILFKKRI